MSHEVYRNLWMSMTMITIPTLSKAGLLFRKTPISSTRWPKMGATVLAPTAKGIWQHGCYRQYVKENVPEFCFYFKCYLTITAVSLSRLCLLVHIVRDYLHRAYLLRRSVPGSSLYQQVKLVWSAAISILRGVAKDGRALKLRCSGFVLWVARMMNSLSAKEDTNADKLLMFI
jgi:hypothetical protein